MDYQKLFKYMSEEHGVTLLETDMQEICNIVNEMQNNALHKPPVMHGLSPIERMIDNSGLTCTKCGSKAGHCDCWIKCTVVGCSWFIEKGHKCGNPNHA